MDDVVSAALTMRAMAARSGDERHNGDGTAVVMHDGAARASDARRPPTRASGSPLTPVAPSAPTVTRKRCAPVAQAQICERMCRKNACVSIC
jgi:acetyl-CoA acetyltransferase